MSEQLPTFEAFHDTAVFGPHRWAIREFGGDPWKNPMHNLQFTSEHDAKKAIEAANAYGEVMKEHMRDRLTAALDAIY